MEELPKLQKFLNSVDSTTPIGEFVVALLLAALLSTMLAFFYRRYAVTFSNKKSFSHNFVLLTIATMIVISIVKSSIALSLGLVGALSIVRFRAAIKEPEELIYLFLAIAIGLGFGANQIIFTLIATSICFGIIIVRSYFSNNSPEHGCIIIVKVKNEPDCVEEIINQLKETASQLKVRRMEQSSESTEIAFFAEFIGYEKFLEAQKTFHKRFNSGSMTYLDNREA